MKRELIALSLLVTAASLGAYQTAKAQMREDSPCAVSIKQKTLVIGGSTATSNLERNTVFVRPEPIEV